MEHLFLIFIQPADVCRKQQQQQPSVQTMSVSLLWVMTSSLAELLTHQPKLLMFVWSQKTFSCFCRTRGFLPTWFSCERRRKQASSASDSLTSRLLKELNKKTSSSRFDRSLSFYFVGRSRSKASICPWPINNVDSETWTSLSLVLTLSVSGAQDESSVTLFDVCSRLNPPGIVSAPPPLIRERLCWCVIIRRVDPVTAARVHWAWRSEAASRSLM